MGEEAKLSPFITYCFTVNYIVGVGFLSMPGAFVKAGLLFSLLLLLLGSFVLLCTCWWIVDSIARCQAIKRKDEGIAANTSDDQLFLISDEKTDLNDVLGYVTWPWMQTLFSVFLGLVLYTAMWSAVVVFASTLTNLVPIPGLTMGMTCDLNSSNMPDECNTAYFIYGLLFMVITLPLSCLDLVEQKYIQLALTIFRFVALFFIFVTTSVALTYAPYNRNNITISPYTADVPLLDVRYIGTIFPVAVFAQLLHHSVPFLIGPLNNKLKSKYVFLGAITTTFILYSVLSLLTGSYFGRDTQPIVSLNWVNYSGYGFFGFENGNVLTKLVSIVILMFPPLDIISAYPLNLIALANSMFISMPSRFTKDCTDYRVRLFTRFSIAIPTVVLGLFIRRFDVIVEISGTFAFFIAIIGPAIAYIYTDKMAMQYFGKSKTPYATVFCNRPLAYAVLIFGVLGFIYEMIDVIIRISQGYIQF